MPEFLSKANAHILKFNRKIFVPSSNLDPIISIQSRRVPELKLFYRILGVYESSRTVPPRSSPKIHKYFRLFKFSIGHNFSQFVIVILVLADVFTYNIQSKYHSYKNLKSLVLFSNTQNPSHGLTINVLLKCRILNSNA